MAPHLALPVLTAYLRQQKKKVIPIDANVEFFVNYLLTPETLSSMVLAARDIVKAEGYESLPSAWQELLKRELSTWEKNIQSVSQILSIHRDGQEFYSPEKFLPAQDQIQGFLFLASLAYWPGRISFNHYQRGDIRTEADLVELCEDDRRNIFLPFWRERMLPRIRENAPFLVGISISSVHQFISALTLARLLRRELPEIHVVIGGRHVLRIQDKLAKYPFYFRTFFHSAILHEGEHPLDALINTLVAGAEIKQVPNMIFLSQDRPATTALTDPPQLETLPYPDFSDVPWDQYLVPKRYVPIRMSEGCYWGKCTFCARYGDKDAVMIPPERVVNELEHLRDVYGVQDISVNDDCMPPEYWEAVCGIILNRRLDLSMLIWAKPVAGFTRRRLQMMARAGVRQIRWGVESAHPRILRLMRKGTTLATTKRVLGDAHELGIWNHTCLILGFPTETRQEAQGTLDFVKSNQAIIQSFILYEFILYRSSYIFCHPEEYGIHDIQVETTPFFDSITYKTNRGMRPEELHSLVVAAKSALLNEAYGWPLWYYLKLREYLQLYLDRYGLEGTLSLPFERKVLRRFEE
jgi:anaerobic magnesium-protoporphyrin IX monomethyl ester cyclase